MAIVKLYFNESAARTIEYVLDHGNPGDPVDGVNCIADAKTFAGQFKAVRDVHDFKRGNEAVHIFQSWSPEESGNLDPEAFNAMGRELASRKFPGHQAAVVTHTDRDHIHNHIVVNTVNLETGKRIHNKYRHLHELRALNDEICLDRGLSIPNQEAKTREMRMPDKVERMNRFNRSSYLMDMKQKIDFARAYATSYDELGAILGEFNVTARVEDRNITYFYPGQARGKRGKNLGRSYDKPGLERTFKANDEKFQSMPGLRPLVRGKLDELRAAPGAINRLAGELMAETGGHVQITTKKDYSHFTKVPRRQLDRDHQPRGKGVDPIVPLDEIERARRTDIIDYCRRNRIPVHKGTDGQWCLTGREHVSLREFEWTNTQNGTRGSLIDLVAAHKNLTFLHAIAEINGNPRLLLLEQHLGATRRKFSSFYVPAADRASGPAAVRKVSDFLESLGGKPELAESLLKNHPVHVSKAGTIRFFGKDDDSGAVEFFEERPGTWQRRDRGEVRRPFATVPGQGRKAVVFLDPISFLRRAEPDMLAGKKGHSPVVAMLTPSSKVMDWFLAENPHVEQMQFVTKDPKAPKHAELDFFNTLKGRYKHLEIGLEFVGIEHLSLGRGLEMSFF